MPRDLQYAYMEVPENWDDPNSERLNIFYYGRWDASVRSPRPVLLIINGGPGSTSYSTHEAMADELRRLNLSFIFFDQRGVGCSSPYPAFTKGAISRFANYGSKEIIRDAEAIRKTLIGNNPWRVFGHSFGAKVALRYVSVFPRSIEKAVIMGDSAGVSPAATVCYIKASIRKRKLIFDELAASKQEFIPLLKTLQERLAPDKCYGDSSGIVRLCGYDVIRGMGHSLGPDNFDRIFQDLRGLLNPDGSVNYRALDQLVHARLSWYINPSFVLIAGQDYPLFLNGQSVCSKALIELAGEGFKLPSWALESCIGKRALDQLPPEFKKQGTVLQWSDVRAGLHNNPRLTIEEFIGDADALNPEDSQCDKLDSGQSATQKETSQWKTIHIPNMGHSGIFQQPEFWEALSQ